MRVALVSCVKSKQSSSAPAKDLYTSALFRKMRAYAEAHADAWFILSAEYGLLRPDEVVAPYEKTLNRMRVADRKAWAAQVQQQLSEVLPEISEVMILAGERYRLDLVPYLRQKKHFVTIPFEGLSFGRQLQRLTELSEHTTMARESNFMRRGRLADLTSRAAVLRAIDEFDRLGREVFLAKYGFGESRRYFLVYGGNRYDSKAIVGAAFGFQHSETGPLRPSDFSGGELTVQKKLEELGFTLALMPSTSSAS